MSGLRGQSADLAFDALADPVRREILAVLGDADELSAGGLAERISSVGRTAVSTHLRVLRLAGLVTERRAGRFRYYAIDPDGAAADVIAALRGLFHGSLADVRRSVEPGAGESLRAAHG
ncbi:ArsR/SmtB family transcription factor [Pseudonocardia phyllosphaerae]|uniref:ArsR/SmtB family transcription factor n=1 Tax=Pseudonocardia phyllosphaerae TaxID=3390502 RepID=UPI00397B1892